MIAYHSSVSICSYLTLFPGQTFIRLVASDIPLQGRVEVIHKGIWGTVCNTGWSREDARVTCRELGFYDVLDRSFRMFNDATGRIWLRNLQCDGDEKSLVLCKHEKWKKNSCLDHSNDVGVKCEY